MTERQIHIESVGSVVEKKLDSIANLLQEEIKHRREIVDEFRNWMRDQCIIMFARRNQVRLPACLLSREYFDPIIIEMLPNPTTTPYYPQRTGAEPNSVGNPYC